MTGLYTRAPADNKAAATGQAVAATGQIGSPCYSRWVMRPRSSAPGPDRPCRHRSPSIPGLLLPFVAAVALIAAACGSAQVTVAPSTSAAAGSTADASTSSTSPAASDTESTTPAPSEAPSEAPSASAEAGASVAIEPATDCTGTDENRTFYGSVAAAVAWTVYCPVLPSGWFVETGQYRLAGGGRLAIAYRGPGGARFTLEEGAWCTDGSGCVPSGTDMGATAFGDREGTLIATETGSFAIVVDASATISWSLVGVGLDEATVRSFGAALIAVGG